MKYAFGKLTTIAGVGLATAFLLSASEGRVWDIFEKC